MLREIIYAHVHSIDRKFKQRGILRDLRCEFVFSRLYSVIFDIKYEPPVNKNRTGKKNIAIKFTLHPADCPRSDASFSKILSVAYNSGRIIDFRNYVPKSSPENKFKTYYEILLVFFLLSFDSPNCF